MTDPMPQMVAMIRSIIQRHHHTIVRGPTRTRNHRVTFHSGDEKAAYEILTAIRAYDHIKPENG